MSTDATLRAAERAYQTEPSEPHREAVRLSRERGGLPLRFRDLAVGEAFQWDGRDVILTVQEPGRYGPAYAIYPQPPEDWEQGNRYSVTDPDKAVLLIPPGSRR